MGERPEGDTDELLGGDGTLSRDEVR